MDGKTLDQIASEVIKNNTDTKFQAAKELQEYLRNPANTLECENFDKLVDGLATWVSSSNFKVSLNGLDCLIKLVDRMGKSFKIHIGAALPPTVERLGDGKEQVRQEAKSLIQNLMGKAATPQYVFERLMKAFSHKAWRVREEILLCLIDTINVFGAGSLTLNKIVPSICKLLGDPNSQVRDTAINTLVEIYRHVGEKVRIDLGKKGIPSSRLSIIYAKFDEVKRSGRMLVPSEPLSPKASGNDETDSDKSAAAQKKAPARRVSSATTQKKTPAASSSSRPSSGSSSAAFVDADTFINSFEDVPSITIYSNKNCEEELSNIYKITSNEKADWEARVNGLKRLRSVVIAGGLEYDCFLPSLRLIEEALILSAKDLRSQVVREACITLAFLSTKLGRQFDHAAEAVLPTLFQLIPNSAKVMSNCGCVCLDFILKHTHNPRLIPVVKGNITSKSKDIRKYTCNCINTIVSTWSSHHMEKHVMLLSEAIHKGIEDADAEARALSRKSFWKFKEHFSSHAQKLFDQLDPSKQKMLQGEMSGASSLSSLNSDKGARKLSAGSHENLSRVGLLPRRTSATSSRIKSNKTETDGPIPLGPRSSSEVNLAAATRARTRYTTARSPGHSAEGSSRLARSKSTSRDSLDAAVIRRKRRGMSLDRQAHSLYIEPEPSTPSKQIPKTPNGRSVSRTGRQKSRLGISQSTPGSKTNSRSSSPSTTRLPHIATNGSLGRSRRKSGIPVPRSQGASREASREASPSRYGGLPSRERRSSGNGSSRDHYTHKQLLSQKILGTGRDIEAALATALSELDTGLDADGALASGLENKLNLRRWDSDEESDASSVCSVGSHGSTPRLEDVPEILAKMSSPAWSERKEGLMGLQYVLQANRPLVRSEIKRVTELFTRMFADPHGKTYTLFLDVLCDFVERYRDNIHDWMFVLMTRLFQKLGSDMLMSILAKVQRSLEVVRDCFPPEKQFRILMKYIVDQTQTPNAKVKVAVLNFLEGLTDFMEPVHFQNSSETRLAVSRIISWIKEAKSLDVRKASQQVLIALFELNSPEFSAMLQFFPRNFQDTATKLLQSHLQKSTEVTAAEVRQKGSPRGTYRSPRSVTSPRERNHNRIGSQENLDSLNSEEIIKSFRRTTAEIQSFLSNSRDDLDSIKDESPRIESDRMSADSGLTNSMPDIRVDSPEGKGLVDNMAKLRLAETGFENQFVGENGEDLVQPLLTELQNHNGKYEERKTAMTQLIQLSRSENVSIWDKHFKTILFLMLETLRDQEPTIRAMALRVLRDILRYQPDRFKDYAELTILKILEAHKDIISDVVRAAEETSAMLANTIPPIQSVNVLCPIIQTGEIPINQAAIKMLSKVIEIMSYDEVTEILSEVVPALLKSYDHNDSSVRKASVFCLVALHGVIGDELKNYLGDLPGSKMKLLNLYIKRAQTEKTSSCSSPSPSSPTSLSTSSR